MTDKEKIANNKLVMLNGLEQKVARVLWPGIDVQEPWTPEGQALVQQSIEKLKEIFNISEKPVSEDLEEAAENHALKCHSKKASVATLAASVYDFKAGANWQKEQIKKMLDLGEPPYLISVEQAYYRIKKYLED